MKEPQETYAEEEFISRITLPRLNFDTEQSYIIFFGGLDREIIITNPEGWRIKIFKDCIICKPRITLSERFIRWLLSKI